METLPMEINHAIIMQEAKADLTGKWGVGVAAYIVYAVIFGIASLLPFATLLLAGPFAVGCAILGLNFAKNEHAQVSNIFDGFKQFGDSLIAGILVGIGAGLGFLFFIVPGVILAIGWSMTYCIIAEEPQLGAVDAMKKSWAMMDGHKMDYCIMGLKFILLGIACIFTLGIGFFFLAPYVQTCIAKYYLVLRKNQGDDEHDITEHLIV